MRKRLWTAAAAAVMAASMSLTAYAGAWKQDNVGWWWQNDDGSYPVSCWQWLDGNGDGIAESYCFDAVGYMYANTTTPDGYTVNADGAWTVNGVVQTQTQTVPQGQTQTQGQTQGSEIRIPRSMTELDQYGEPLEYLFNMLGDEQAVCRTLTANLIAMISELDSETRQLILDIFGFRSVEDFNDVMHEIEASGAYNDAYYVYYLPMLDTKAAILGY